ncbi:hypothetical protein [uncultured Tenacibaculum sp.]|uniref:hypothetical protein n=1 Tax=uncultured Tenacibaculum sp. TaxID=174713 RepID=UPI002621FAF5|nr:hypothetical protein [uncultured Tenacibaculum sp.]
MKYTEHCDLCEYSKRDYKSGLSCGLTNKKPNFKIVCSNIKFSKYFKESQQELLNEIREIKKQKTQVYIEFTLFGLIGFIIIMVNFHHFINNSKIQFSFNYSYWNYFARKILIFSTGFILILRALLSIKRYRNKLKKAESKKKE